MKRPDSAMSTRSVIPVLRPTTGDRGIARLMMDLT